MLSLKLLQSAQTFQPLWWKESKIFKVLFQVTPTNVDTGANPNPYVAGGDTCDLTQLFNTASSAPGELLPTFELVVIVRFLSNRAQGGAGNGNLYVYNFAPGTTLANGTMQIFTGAAAQTALTELAAGNYPANVLNDVIVGEAYFIVP